MLLLFVAAISIGKFGRQHMFKFFWAIQFPKNE